MPAIRSDTATSDDERSSFRIKRETTEYLDDITCGRGSGVQTVVDCHSGTESSSTAEHRNVDESSNGSAPERCERMRMTPTGAAATLTSAALMALRTRRRPPTVLQCKECDRAFTRKSEYTVHMRKHTNERPFVCDVSVCREKRKGHVCVDVIMVFA